MDNIRSDIDWMYYTTPQKNACQAMKEQVRNVKLVKKSNLLSLYESFIVVTRFRYRKMLKIATMYSVSFYPLSPTTIENRIRAWFFNSLLHAWLVS